MRVPEKVHRTFSHLAQRGIDALHQDEVFYIRSDVFGFSIHRDLGFHDHSDVTHFNFTRPSMLLVQNIPA